MKNTFILCAFLALSSFTVAQQSEKYPLGDYTELTDTKPHDSDEIWDKLSAPIKLGHDRYTISETQYSRCQEKQSLADESMERGTGKRTSRVMDQGGTRGCLYHRERLKERFFHHPILRYHDELCPLRHDR